MTDDYIKSSSSSNNRDMREETATRKESQMCARACCDSLRHQILCVPREEERPEDKN